MGWVIQNGRSELIKINNEGEKLPMCWREFDRNLGKGITVCFALPERARFWEALFGWMGPTPQGVILSPGPETHQCQPPSHYGLWPCMQHHGKPVSGEKNISPIIMYHVRHLNIHFKLQSVSKKGKLFLDGVTERDVWWCLTSFPMYDDVDWQSLCFYFHPSQRTTTSYKRSKAHLFAVMGTNISS